MVAGLPEEERREVTEYNEHTFAALRLNRAYGGKFRCGKDGFSMALLAIGLAGTKQVVAELIAEREQTP